MAKPPQECCSQRPRFIWRRFDDSFDNQPAENQSSPAHGWLSETSEVSFASRLKQPKPWEDAHVTVILTSANDLRECKTCRASLREAYGIPDFWWAKYCQKANGFYGSSPTRDAQGRTVSQTSWGKFRAKLVHDANKYKWFKINIFVNWKPHRSTVLFFDPDPDRLEPKIPDAFFQQLLHPELVDPFWVYSYVLNELASTQDDMVWAFRDKVRLIEKARATGGGYPPDFGRLHELARHSVHFMELFKLTSKTINSIIRDHAALGLPPLDHDRPSDPPAGSPAPSVPDKLHFFEHMLESLAYRASSNHERLHNEIQLQFNLVTQYDAKISLELSKAMREDGAATKALTLLAASFLPATFICALFSMSFFSYEPDHGWAMSGMIWIYFVFAIPATFLTLWIWQKGSLLVSLWSRHVSRFRH